MLRAGSALPQRAARRNWHEYRVRVHSIGLIRGAQSPAPDRCQCKEKHEKDKSRRDREVHSANICGCRMEQCTLDRRRRDRGG